MSSDSIFLVICDADKIEALNSTALQMLVIYIMTALQRLQESRVLGWSLGHRAVDLGVARLCSVDFTDPPRAHLFHRGRQQELRGQSAAA